MQWSRKFLRQLQVAGALTTLLWPTSCTFLNVCNAKPTLRLCAALCSAMGSQLCLSSTGCRAGTGPGLGSERSTPASGIPTTAQLYQVVSFLFGWRNSILGRAAAALTALGNAANPFSGRWKVEGGTPRCPFSPAAAARHGRAPARGTRGGGARSVTWRRHFLCPCFALNAAAVPPAPRPARGGCGRATRPRLPPPHTAGRRGGGGRGGGWGRGSAKNSPRLIKRWGPVPAPYKYARCAAGGLWPARLASALQAGRCSQRSRAATAAASAARTTPAPAPRHPSEMPRVDADLKLDFKDVLVRPKRSSLKSRAEVGASKPSMLFLPLLNA